MVSQMRDTLNVSSDFHKYQEQSRHALYDDQNGYHLEEKRHGMNFLVDITQTGVYYVFHCFLHVWLHRGVFHGTNEVRQHFYIYTEYK
jgi:hypothetical protein